MKPPTNHSFEDPNIPRLSKQLNPSHPLCLLAELVEWEEWEVVDKGYVGHNASHLIVYKSGQKKGVKTHAIKRFIKRRQAIEPHIGHMKSEGKLGRNLLKGFWGDQINGILGGIGHNLRLLFNFFQKQQAFA